MGPSRTRVSRNLSRSPTPSDSENTSPILRADMSNAELLKVARQLEAAKNTAETELKLVSRRFEDITNNRQSEQVERTRKRRRVDPDPDPFSEDLDGERGDTNHQSIANERFVLQAGHKFGLIHALWIHSGDDLFDADIDDHYNEAQRFENNHYKMLGQFHEILNLVQVRFEKQALRQRWFRRQFMLGLSSQRYNTSTRIRRHCASILGATESELLTSEARKEKFRREIGWADNAGTYSSVDVPILHKDWNGEYSLSSIFLNQKLMGIYVALVRGPRAALHFMRGEIIHPQTETMAKIHNIRNITTGAIATCAILARWALSGDEILQDVGSITGIHYFNDYDEYLTMLETGLRQKKKSVLNIIKQWDEKIFPDYDPKGAKGSSSGLKKLMDGLEADSEEDNQLGPG